MKRIENVWKCRKCGRTSEKRAIINKQYRQRTKCPYCGSQDLKDSFIVTDLLKGFEIVETHGPVMIVKEVEANEKKRG